MQTKHDTGIAMTIIFLFDIIKSHKAQEYKKIKNDKIERRN